MREALLYEKRDGGDVECRLCAHRCRIKPSKRGLCCVRENREGVLTTLVYGVLISRGVDPIEKKPLFHVYPGSKSFSVAAVGCNFRCTFCQNHEISQLPRERGDIVGRQVTPGEIVEGAAGTGCRTISYTYTEPTIYFEYAYDTAVIARSRGLKNVFVTNGFMTPEALAMIAPYLDAANVDLKSFRDDFYRKMCGARLQPVLDTLRAMKERGVWVEVTTLLIPSLNDGDDELRAIAGFIRSLGTETPWHVSRFTPRYKMTDLPPTSARSVQKAVDIGRESGLKYVYSGNIPGDDGEKTFCAHCGEMLLDRYGFSIRKQNISGSGCPRCGTQLEGIF
jgi:pyruvate formate lyase activating enzyme